MGELRQGQQALRDRLNQLLEELKNRGFGQNQQGQQGQGQQGQNDLDQLGRAGEAMGQAEAVSARAIPTAPWIPKAARVEALRKGAQSLAHPCSSRLGQGPGRPARAGRLGQSRADGDTDPLGRPLRGRDYGDDATVQVPGENRRAARPPHHRGLRKRFGDMGRPQEELDYIERLLEGLLKLIFFPPPEREE